MSGERRTTTSIEPAVEAVSLATARFVPQRYEPNYPYPLLVMFHGRGGDEHQMVRSMPAMTWRNYVGLGLRGPEVAIRREHHDGYGWGAPFARPDRRHVRPAPQLADRDVFRRAIETDGPADALDALEDGVFDAIRDLRRTLHVHSERIFLVGTGEGAAVAYRLGLTYPERFAGVIAINGWLPSGDGFRPLGRLKDCRSLRILAVHGEWNARAPIEAAKKQVASLRAGGLRVAFQTYPCAHRLTSPMMADVDTWLINQCTAPV
jgi:phospholipase/carboxylesterase